nr:putative metallocarboxypeptidase ecm14 [Quercus suber]
MRLPLAALLVLPPTFLSSLVGAVPSPATHIEPPSPQQRQQQQIPFSAPSPLLRASPPRSRWRALSDRLVETWFGPARHHQSAHLPSTPRPDRNAPPHTMARYGGDVVLRFNISTSDEARSLADAADTLLLDVWEFSQDWVDIRLAKDIVAPLLGLLPRSLQDAHAPLLQERELAQAILDSYPTPQAAPAHAPPPQHVRFRPDLDKSGGPESNIFFAEYQPLSVIEPWMKLLASLFTTHVRKIDIGVSYQGRAIPALRVGVHPTNKEDRAAKKRPTVLVTAGLHAREWISTSTVNFLAYSLITGYGKIPHITSLLHEFDFVFVPTVNPDGYVYSWETDRLWRKNRQQTSLRFCQGIDLDRAFAFGWDGATTTVGNPCSESYAGESPFEAVEAQRLADWARNETEHNNVEFVGFLDLHSYSQEILYPYSYSCDATPPGLENLEELAIGLEKAIRISHGHSYEVLPACQGNVAASAKPLSRKPPFSSSSPSPPPPPPRLWPRMESAGGSALDFFYHELRVRYAYQIKLRDRGTYGFLLPKENIVPTGKEMLDALLYFGNFLSENHEPNLAAAAAAAKLSLPLDLDRTDRRVAEDDHEHEEEQEKDEGEDEDDEEDEEGVEDEKEVDDEDEEAWIVIEDLFDTDHDPSYLPRFPSLPPDHNDDLKRRQRQPL